MTVKSGNDWKFWVASWSLLGLCTAVWTTAWIIIYLLLVLHLVI